MEKAKTPKRRPFYRRYKKPSAICVGVYAERNSDEVRREKSEHGPDCLGESFLCSDYMDDDNIFPSYWVWQKVSTTFTQTIQYTET